MNYITLRSTFPSLGSITYFIVSSRKAFVSEDMWILNAIEKKIHYSALLSRYRYFDLEDLYFVSFPYLKTYLIFIILSHNVIKKVRFRIDMLYQGSTDIHSWLIFFFMISASNVHKVVQCYMFINDFYFQNQNPSNTITRILAIWLIIRLAICVFL